MEYYLNHILTFHFHKSKCIFKNDKIVFKNNILLISFPVILSLKLKYNYSLQQEQKNAITKTQFKFNIYISLYSKSNFIYFFIYFIYPTKPIVDHYVFLHFICIIFASYFHYY